MAVKRVIIILVSIIILTLAFTLGYFAARSQSADNLPPVIEQNGNFVKVSPIFDNQLATINGKITKLDGEIATVQNFAGKSDNFPLSKGVLIYLPPDKNSPSSPSSSDLKDIELNKDAFISLKAINERFELTSISYTLPTSNQKVSTPSATPKGGR